MAILFFPRLVIFKDHICMDFSDNNNFRLLPEVKKIMSHLSCTFIGKRVYTRFYDFKCHSKNE